MSKHLIIWNSAVSHLREVVEYCVTSIADLKNLAEIKKIDINKQREYITNLEPDDRTFEMENMAPSSVAVIIRSVRIRKVHKWTLLAGIPN